MISLGFLSLWLWKDGSAQQVVVALSGALAVIAPTDVVRLNSPRFARVYERLLGFLMRESEKVKLSTRIIA
jgi:diacylglycerol kinase (CTP)